LREFGYRQFRSSRPDMNANMKPAVTQDRSIELLALLNGTLSGFTKQEAKKAIGLLANMHGLRTIPIGMGTAPSGSGAPQKGKAKDDADRRQPPPPKAAYKQTKEYHDLEKARSEAVAKLKVADPASKDALTVNLRSIEQKIKELKVAKRN